MILCSVFLHFGMAFIVKCSLTIEHVIIAIPSIEEFLKVRGFMGGLSPLAPDKLRPWSHQLGKDKDNDCKTVR